MSEPFEKLVDVFTSMVDLGSQALAATSRTISREKCPMNWDLALIDGDGVLAWGFLVESGDLPRQRRRPWLILEVSIGELGVQRVAVPRLVPEAGWASSEAYASWLEAAIEGETDPIPAKVGLDDAHRLLRWRLEPDRIRAVVSLDLRGMSPSELLQREEPWHFKEPHCGTDVNSVLRTRRRHAQEDREDLAAAGGLPWAAFEKGILPHDWRSHPSFLKALEDWRRHALDLGHRATWEDPQPEATARDAALFCIRLAGRQWSGLPAIGPEWSDVSGDVGGGRDTLAVARSLLQTSACQSNEATFERWAAGLLAAPGQPPGQSDWLLASLERTNSIGELRAAWG